MYEYYDLYQKAHGNADAQERWARQLIWEVARHAVGEEIVVYPLMEQYMGADGVKQADHDREEHQVRSRLVSLLRWSVAHVCLFVGRQRDVVTAGEPHPRFDELFRVVEKSYGSPEAP